MGGLRLLPVLLGQVGLHVEEDILPFLDVCAHLLDELRLLLTGMALVPVVGSMVEEARALFSSRKSLNALGITLGVSSSINTSHNLSTPSVPR